MSVSHQLFQVDGNPVAITNHSIFGFGTSVCIQNTSGSAYVYLGGSTVSPTSFGFRIDPGQTFTADLAGQDSVIWAIAGNGSTAPVAVMYLEQR
jgi:hypothetical protein